MSCLISNSNGNTVCHSSYWISVPVLY